ncbi:MAG: tetratricopeptide repeat protein [Deltaproteobacteria bacterium]|nr:tetratricopeptide repeat protein [Deltaproteobacteria bacterium]
MRKDRFYLFILALAGFIIYSNTLWSPFVFDDDLYIVNNPDIRDLRNFLNISGTRYVGYLSFALNYAFGGYGVLGYHLVNIFIHIANSLLVYALAVALSNAPIFRGSVLNVRLFAFSAALLFITHPLQTQAVTYITQRFASLAAFFYLMSLVLYLKARGDCAGGGTRRRFLFFYAGSLLAALLAMKTKEISFTLPFVAALFEFTFYNRETGFRQRLNLLSPFFITLLVVLLSFVLLDITGAGQTAERMRAMQLKELLTLSRSEYLFTEFSVISTYLRLLVLPVGQNLIYDYPVYSSFFEPRVVLSFVFLLSIFVLAVYLYIKGRGYLGVMGAIGIFWFFITLSIESSIIPIKDVIFEHRVYLPSIGWSIAAAALFFYLAGIIKKGLGLKPSFEAIALVAVVSVAAIFSTAAYLRNRVWADEATLWEDVVKKSPRSSDARTNLATALYEKGDKEAALSLYIEAIRLNPGNDGAYYNLAGIYYERKEYGASALNYEKAIALVLPDDPRSPAYRYNLAIVYYEMGDMDKARLNYIEAIRGEPENDAFHYNLGNLYMDTADYGSAIRHYSEAVRLNPLNDSAHFNLGRAYQIKGEFSLAISHYNEALAINPKSEDARRNLNVIYMKQRGGGQ